MWTRVNGMTVSSFKKSEDGAILVFFAICCAAIFLVASLSFDVGRRASTQTELQSFADNVALAAAGELNGFSGSVWRAQNAANNLIKDRFTIGSGDRTLSGSSDFTLKFYSDLPDDESAWLEPLTISLNSINVDPVNDRLARFVRVELNDTEVPWVFAKVLKLFSTDNFQTLDTLRFVTAEATAGYTSLACDVAPIFFCMPDDDGDPTTPSNWDPSESVGDQILIRTGQQKDSFWEAGNFGWLDVRDTFPDESKVNPNGDCFGETGVQLLVCLIAAENAVTTCFENGELTTLPGQKQGIESAVFNTRFDMYNSVVSNYAGTKNFEPAPLVGRGFVDSKGDACYKNSVVDVDTIPFPVDDCYPDCTGVPGNEWNGVPRFGDGVWRSNRMEYVERNYSVDGDSWKTIQETEVLAGPGDAGYIEPTTDNPTPDQPPLKKKEVYVHPGSGEEYHVDDLFRPGRTMSGPNDLVLYNKDDSYTVGEGDDATLVIEREAMRFDYYVAEVLLTYWDQVKNLNGGYTSLTDAFLGYKNNPDTFFKDANFTLPSGDLMPDLVYADGTTLARTESNLPACSPAASTDRFSPDPRRRVVVAAAIDCSQQEVNGKKDDVTASYFVEVFLTQPVKGDPVDKKKFDMHVEIIGPPLNVGDDKVTKGTFRNLVQLYR